MLVSTRSNCTCSASFAIVKGLADDGGLFVFEKLNNKFFTEKLIGKTYKEVAFFVMRELLEDFTDIQIKQVIEDSYDTSHFPKNIVELKEVDGKTFLNLFYGNTFAFKDMALSVLPILMETAKQILGFKKKSVILTATSGDTGSSTLSGFSSISDAHVIVLYPKKGISEFQELQMNHYRSKNHIVLPVDGNFDDCQRIAKQAFLTIKPKHIAFSSANSINIGRIIPQIIYYVYAYCELVNKGKVKYGDLLNVTVPTGNFGNIYSAFLAKQLGVPIGKLIIASNMNCVLTDIFNRTVYDTKRELHKTISPSMDILVSSNFERYLYHVLGNNPYATREYMEQLRLYGTVIIDPLVKQTDFFAYYASEEKTKETIKKTFDKTGYLIDTHTAVAKYCADKYIKENADKNHMLIVSTASPFKFSDAMLEVFDIKTKGMTLMDKLEKLSQISGRKIDKRILEIIKTSKAGKKIPLKKVYKKLKKIVGEIDAEN